MNGTSPIGNDQDQSDFQALNPSTILRIIEEAFGKKMTGLCRPYTSYINRVYELQTEEGESVVAKFYRPGRWEKQALQEEHEFLLELAQAEVPIIAPLILKEGATLGVDGKMYFALFPKKGGRSCDELRDDDWLQIGRLLGRVHQIGASHPAKSRVTWSPGKITTEQVKYILGGNFIPSALETEYSKVTQDFIELADPVFDGLSLLRIHGDFHFANLIFRPGESFFMIDFDDMAMGPSVQDLWMLLPGFRDKVQREINLFAEGYETFRSFSYPELKLIEILRAMRYVHFCAWCAHQVRDGRFLQSHPNWGTLSYWRREIRDLHEQIERIHSELSHFAY